MDHGDYEEESNNTLELADLKLSKAECAKRHIHVCTYEYRFSIRAHIA
jgi:hypothetical protein